MEPQTNVANTKNWLDASRDIRLSAYTENYVSTLAVQAGVSSGERLYDALNEVSVLFQLGRTPGKERLAAAVEKIRQHVRPGTPEEIEEDIDAAFREVRQGA